MTPDEQANLMFTGDDIVTRHEARSQARAVKISADRLIAVD